MQHYEPVSACQKIFTGFMMFNESAADRAFSNITAGSSYRVIPWQMDIIAKLLRLLPNWLYDVVLSGRPRKKRRGE